MSRISYLLISALSLFSISASALSIQSSAFIEGNNIPPLYTCDDKDSSPELSWAGAPTGTKSFALIVTDPDAAAGTWTHWVVYNIPATVTELFEGHALPDGALAGENSFGKNQYNGPCPPKGSKPHHYIFTLYALDQVLTMPAAANVKALEANIEGHVLAKASLLGLFAH